MLHLYRKAADMRTRIVTALAALSLSVVPLWGPAVAAGGAPAPSVRSAAAECSEECRMGLHEFCPYALESSEDFDCSCSCHDNLFDLEAGELGFRR